MNSLDVATYISKQCDESVELAIQFIENQLDIIISEENTEAAFSQYRITYNKLDKLFHFDEVKKLIMSLWKHLDEQQQQQLINACKTSNKKTTGKHDITITNNNIASANASNENIINISTLSQLSNQVEQNTNIENKQEIKNLISQLEVAKDENDEEGYFDLFFKLTEKLENTGLIPVWLAKSAKFAKKFIDK